MVTIIQEYSSLINIALLGVIIGWLFHISRLSRISIIDKFEAKLAAKDQEIEYLKQHISTKEEKHKSELAEIKHGRDLFEKIASLPKDEAAEALRIEYQLRLENVNRQKEELDLRESLAKSMSEVKEINEERSELNETEKSIKTIIDSAKQAIDVLRAVSSIL